MGIDGLIPSKAPQDSGPAFQRWATQVWRNLWPWAELNAKGVPEDYLHLGRDIGLVLANLIAQGPDGPHFLQLDALKRLLTVSSGVVTDLLSAPITAGSSAAIVATVQLYGPGTWLYFFPPNGVGGNWTRQPTLYQVRQVNPNISQLLVAGSFGENHAAGDLILVLQPSVKAEPGHRSTGGGGQLGGSVNAGTAAAAWTNLGSALGVNQIRLYGWSGSGVNAAGGVGRIHFKLHGVTTGFDSFLVTHILPASGAFHESVLIPEPWWLTDVFDPTENVQLQYFTDLANSSVDFVCYIGS